MMKAKRYLMAAWLALLCAQLYGGVEIVAGSINAGGTSMATNSAGTMKLSGSIAQHGFTSLSTNVAGRSLQSGFWWADDVQMREPSEITGILRGTNTVGIAFTMVSGNWYQVLYITDAEGGIPAGRHSFTNEASALFEASGVSTTIWHNVSSPADKARFYLIKCQ